MAVVMMSLLQNEKKLCKVVQKYPVLYDKNDPSFHSFPVKENAWKEVAKELMFESGDAAKALFTSIRTGTSGLWIWGMMS